MPATQTIHEAAHGLVVSDPGILGGKPVFRGTRLPVTTFFEYLADGLSLDYFFETLPSITRVEARLSSAFQLIKTIVVSNNRGGV